MQPHELDLHTFEDLAARAALRRAEGFREEALDLLHRAMALWRGEPLEDLPVGAALEADLARLVEGRLTAAEERLALMVELGTYATAISEAQAMLRENPFREQLWRHLMVALHRSGRRAEALRAYVDVRERLVEEMGVEPGPELRRAHAMVLADDPPDDEQRTAPARFPAISSALPSVLQLPPDIPDFSGRTRSIRELTEMLSRRRDTGAAPAAVVVTGAPGVGKSTLALHVAHAVRADFPDGQLYADLAGTTASPREPGELLAEALRALGVTGTAIPKSFSERAALYRTRLADRRMLVVLDDAADVAQVKPLLPTTATCAVIVTSRHRLAELPGAHPVVLDALRPEDARELMDRIIGRERTEREPGETAAILGACGYLPLAIRIAGAKLAGRKVWTLGVLRDRLADESQRISELQVGDLGIRTSFEMSMRMLPAAAARAFRLLGMLGAQAFPGWVIDALLDRRFANDVLDALLDAHLLELADVDATGRPRYRLHDLLRAYAMEAAGDDPPQLRRAALTRVLGGWLALAEQVADRLPATVNRAAPGSAPRWRLDPGATEQLIAAPRAWFEAERHSLLAAVWLAIDNGLDEFAWEMAVCLVPYLDHLSLFEDWRRCHEGALPAVRAARNRRGEAALLRGLGQVNLYWDDFDQARDDFERSRELSQEIGDKRGEAWALSGLGTVGRILGRHDDALGHYFDVLAAFAVMGDRHLEAQARNSIGAIRLAQGQIEEARTWFVEALHISEDIGDEFRAALVLVNIGELHRLNNEPQRALTYQRQALAALERIEDEQSVAYTLLALGETYAVLREWTQAESACDRAKAIFVRIGDQAGQTACARLLDEVTAKKRRPPH